MRRLPEYCSQSFLSFSRRKSSSISPNILQTPISSRRSVRVRVATQQRGPTRDFFNVGGGDTVPVWRPHGKVGQVKALTALGTGSLEHRLPLGTALITNNLIRHNRQQYAWKVFIVTFSESLRRWMRRLIFTQGIAMHSGPAGAATISQSQTLLPVGEDVSTYRAEPSFRT